jgi:hypothetical protein
MKLLVVLVLISASLSVDALWSSKCKEAETSSDKIVKMIQNANCTLREKRVKLHEGLKTLHEGIKTKVQALRGIFHKNKTAAGLNGLDYAIDVRMLQDSDVNSAEKEEEEAENDEEEEPTTLNARSKRDEEDETTEGEEDETTEGEQVEGEVLCADS